MVRMSQHHNFSTWDLRSARDTGTLGPNVSGSYSLDGTSCSIDSMVGALVSPSSLDTRHNACPLQTMTVVIHFE